MRGVEYVEKINPAIKKTIKAHNVSPEYSAMNEGS